MPIYEYACRKGHRFERMQSFSDAPVRRCPTCGTKSERLISNSAVIFKGSGWYCTDSKPVPMKKKNGEAPKTETKTETPVKKAEGTAAA